MRVAALIASLALPALAQHDAGLVWHCMVPGLTETAAVHNAAQSMPAGNAQGAGMTAIGGVMSNGAAVASWVGIGTNQDITANAPGLTISVWVRIVNHAGTMAFAANVPSSATTGTYFMVSLSSTRRYTYIQSGATKYTGLDISGLPAIHTSNWVHFATVWRGATNMAHYQNGIEYKGAITSAGGGATNWPSSNGCLQPTQGSEPRFGAFSSGNVSLILNGNAMQKGRVYTRGLSSNEVAALYMREYGEIYR